MISMQKYLKHFFATNFELYMLLFLYVSLDLDPFY